jgi:thioredoxin reductase (NADPH)
MGETAAEPSAYDVIVVGAGPAGVSAAINVANRRRSVALMGGLAPFARLHKAQSIANYPGFPQASGEELSTAFLRHLEAFAVPLIPEKISKIIRGDDEFVLFSAQEVYRARALVLATGVYREGDIDGEEDLVGRGVSYCVTCDGGLFRGRRAAFISHGAEGEEEAAALADDYDVEVTYLPLYEADYRLPERVQVLAGTHPTRLAAVDGTMRVTLAAEELLVDAVFIYKEAVSPRALLEGLASDGRHLTVGRGMETSVPGVFAAGDCTGEPYQVAKAVGEGQVAALSAVRFLRRAPDGAAEGGGAV